ncbi:MAG: FlgD immunoglobulin-like domain containing protein [Buchnera aphidicola (Eriosoma harunire)]
MNISHIRNHLQPYTEKPEKNQISNEQENLIRLKKIVESYKIKYPNNDVGNNKEKIIYTFDNNIDKTNKEKNKQKITNNDSNHKINEEKTKNTNTNEDQNEYTALNCKVLIPNDVFVKKDHDSDIQFHLTTTCDYDNIIVVMDDTKQNIVVTKSIGPLQSGTYDFSWKIINHDDFEIPNGRYDITLVGHTM